MVDKLEIEGVEYSADQLSETGRQALAAYKVTEDRLSELNKLTALLMRARSALIGDLKIEVVKSKSGVDLSALLAKD